MEIDDNVWKIVRPTEAWALPLVGKTVLHVPTRTIGLVATFFDGEARQFVSKINGQPVPAPVLLLEDGNAFTARVEEDFAPLERHEAEYFAAVQSSLALVTTALVQEAQKRGITEPKTVALLLASAMKTQAAAIERPT